MKKFDMAVKTGTYQTQGGEKNRYENIGEVHSSEKGGFYARVNPFRMLGVAMASIARGEDSMLVSLFEAKQAPSSSSMPDDDIPF